MTNIVIEIKGGLVQSVYSDKKDVEIRVVDWDNAYCSEDEAERCEQIIEQIHKDSSYRMIY